MIGKKAALFFLVFFIVVRLIWLNADPFWLKHYSDIHDETWWADNARLKLLFGQWQMDEFSGAMAVSPIGTVLHWLGFYFGGINFFSLRFWSALSGLLSIGLIYRIVVKNRLTNPLLITATFASFQTWIMWNRLGHWESTLGFLLLLIYYSLFHTSIRFNLIISSVIAAVGFFIKPTFVYLAIPVFGVFVTSNNGDITHKLKMLAKLSLPGLLIALLFKVFYFDVHLIQFQPYYQHFQSIYYSWFDLINPIYFITKLSGIFRNEFFVQPDVAFILLILLLFKNERNTSVYHLKLLISAIFIGLLFSDFNSRRFIPLLPLLVFYSILSLQAGQSNFSQLTRFQKAMVFIIAIGFLGLFSSSPVILGFGGLFIFIILYFLNQLPKPITHLVLIAASSVVVVASGNYCWQQWFHFEKAEIEFTLFSSLNAWLIVFALILSFSLIIFKYRIKGLIFFFFGFCILSLLKIDFTLQRANDSLSHRIKGAVVGDLFSFEVLLQSKSYMLHYATDSIETKIRSKQINLNPETAVISNFSEFQNEKGTHRSLPNFGIDIPPVFEAIPIYYRKSGMAVYFFNLNTETEEKSADKPK